MAAPDGKEIREFAERHVELWNAEDKDEWLAHWRAAVSGEPRVYDPVGTPVKRGWAAQEEMWDNAPNVDWKLAIDDMIVNGNEVALLMRNTGTVGGQSVVLPSIEIYRFDPDGSLEGKTYWELDAGSAYAEWTASAGEAADQGDDADEGLDREEIRDLMVKSHDLWNAHDKDGWVAAWRAAVTGDCTLDDRATGDVRQGFDACRPEVWDIYNATTTLETLFLVVCGNEAAMVVDNGLATDDGPVTVTSIETYRFGADGSLYEQNWYELPQP